MMEIITATNQENIDSIDDNIDTQPFRNKDL